jgi:hypothetical protein
MTDVSLLVATLKMLATVLAYVPNVVWFQIYVQQVAVVCLRLSVSTVKVISLHHAGVVVSFCSNMAAQKHF